MFLVSNQLDSRVAQVNKQKLRWFTDSAKSKSTKYLYHDDPHSFETSMDFLVVASNNNSLSMSGIAADLDNSATTPEVHDTNANEHIYSNQHFKFEVLETTV